MKYITLLSIILLSACSTISNIKDIPEKKDFVNFSIKDVEIYETRKQIDKQKFIDIPYLVDSAMRSELYTKIDKKRLRKKTLSMLSNDQTEKAKMVIRIIDARQGFIAHLITRTELVLVELELALIKGDKTIITRRSRCYSKKTLFWVNVDNIRKDFDKVIGCALRKGMGLLFKTENSNKKLNTSSDEIFPKIRHKIEKKAKVNQITIVNDDNNSGTIYDTFTSHSNWKMRLYYMTSFEGKEIEKNSLGATRKASYLKSYAYQPVMNSYEVPTGERVLKIKATHYVSAPLFDLVNDNLSLEKKLVVKIQKDKSYYIRGIIDRDIVDVWIEDSNGNMISK